MQSPAGTALRFDGSNDYVTFGSVTPVGRHTIEAWIKPEILQRGAIAGHYAGPRQSCGLGMFIRMDESGLACFVVGQAGCRNFARVCASAPQREWSHLAGAFDGNMMKLYGERERSRCFKCGTRFGEPDPQGFESAVAF